MAFPNIFRIKQWNNISNVHILEVVVSISGVFGSLHGKATMVWQMAVRSLFLKDRECCKRCFLFCFCLLQSQYVSEKSRSPIPKFLLRKTGFYFGLEYLPKKGKKNVVKPVPFTCEFSTLVHYIRLTELWHRPHVEGNKSASLQFCFFLHIRDPDTENSLGLVQKSILVSLFQCLVSNIGHFYYYLAQIIAVSR